MWLIGRITVQPPVKTEEWCQLKTPSQVCSERSTRAGQLLICVMFNHPAWINSGWRCNCCPTWWSTLSCWWLTQTVMTSDPTTAVNTPKRRRCWQVETWELFSQVYSRWDSRSMRVMAPWTFCVTSSPVTPPVWSIWALTHSLWHWVTRILFPARIVAIKGALPSS